uniref:Uncharacterized protein n=1 Tax=Solanum tuberosum TaxID=4113 RepID=M1BSV7_SOLTU
MIPSFALELLIVLRTVLYPNGHGGEEVFRPDLVMVGGGKEMVMVCGGDEDR